MAVKYKEIKERKSESSNEDFNVNDIKNIAEAGFTIAKLTNLLETFCSRNELKHMERDEKLIEKLVNHYPNLWLYQKPFTIVTAIIDLMLSISNEYELNLTISKFIVKKWNFLGNDEKEEYYVRLLKNIINILSMLRAQECPISISSFFNNEIYSLDSEKFKMQCDNRQNLKALLTTDVKDVDDEGKLEEILLNVGKFQSKVNYFKRIVNYVRNIRLMAKFQTNEFLSFNKVLVMMCDYDIIGKIIYKNQLNPDLLATYAYNANINLVHSIVLAGCGEILPPHLRMIEDEKILSLFHLHEIGSSSPTTSSDLNENFNTNRETFDISNTDILYYIKKRGSFLSAYLVKEIQSYDYKTLIYDDDYFQRMKALACVDRLKQLYDNNVALTILNYDHINLKYFFSKIHCLELSKKLKMLSCITERNWQKDKIQFDELKDSYIESLIQTDANSTLDLLKQIGNVRKFNELLLKHIREISRDEVERLLGLSLCAENLKEIDESQRIELEQWMIRLKIYKRILKLFLEAETDDCDVISNHQNITWLTILQMAENNTPVLINFLINVKTNFNLCFEMLKFHTISNKNEEIFKIFIEALNKNDNNSQHVSLFKIIQTLPPKIMIDFFEYSLNYVTSIQSMKNVLKILLTRESPVKNQIKYQKFQLSCKIIEILDENDAQLWELASFPLIIIEQALMNSKIEILNKIVKELRLFLIGQPSCNLCSVTSKNYQMCETLVYDFDAFHTGKWITNDCIDFLFKIYAAKALDFQIVDVRSNQSQQSSTMTPGSQSLDSFQSRIFHMPKEIPTKDKWIRDDEAASCMCCKISKAFSLLNRRHHCRRCGRVVCAECTRNRILLPELYNTLMVRCCNDCFSQLEDEKQKLESGTNVERARIANLPVEWKLTGNIQIDQMIRDEFIFEYSPNVGLCTKILSLHTINDDFTNFLLLHCHRLELLLKPIHGRINQEIDVILVAKMLKHLATAAKLFDNSNESNLIIDHADMILKIAENDSDAILSKVSLTNSIYNISIRDIVNELIKAENWKLALELSVKRDRNSKSGIFSAWAVSLIKGGNYKLAREKIAMALQSVGGSSTTANETFLSALSSNEPLNLVQDTFNYKRPSRSSPLLNEIIEVIELCVSKCPTQHVLTNSSVLNTSTSSSFQMLNTSTPKISANPMDHLKKIQDGDYGFMTRRISEKFDWNQLELVKSHYFEESIYYLISYGGSIDLMDFFMKNNLIRFSVRYALMQHVSNDLFIQFIFTPAIKAGRLSDLIDILRQTDEDLLKSKTYIIAASKYLERKKCLHVLYQLDLLLEDCIRAALTSLKFYLNGAGNYIELNEKSRYLMDAVKHLQTELERVESGLIENDKTGLRLRWDIKKINAQINMILLQLEVSKYLSSCELSGLPTLDLQPKVFLDKISLKTLLGKPNERSQVAILLLICSHSVESAFGLSYR